MKSALYALCAAATLVLATGCSGISVQYYGSHPNYSVTEGATRADVLANLGEPDSIYRGEDTEVFIYKAYRGKNYFGVYATIKRTDKVVVMDPDGVVLAAPTVEIGKGRTYLGATPFNDLTHPVRTEELTEGPENYTYDWTFEQGAD